MYPSWRDARFEAIVFWVRRGIQRVDVASKPRSRTPLPVKTPPRAGRVRFPVDVAPPNLT